MGSLKPGATYIYERAEGVTYAREFGADPSTRKAIGWDYPLKNSTSTGNKELDAHNEWIKIRLAGKTNPALQKAIDRVIIMYKMSQEKYE
ncbi:MAG: hypothetical protein RLZZ196_1848 [Bacteroidota bacterium]|jgi:DUF1680 family protein